MFNNVLQVEINACALAEDLGSTTVLVPEHAGVLSALGLVASDERRDRVRSLVTSLEEAGELPEVGEADLRYRGQSFELTVPLGPDLPSRFHAAHAERYGHADRGRPIELVAVRTAELRPGPELDLRRREMREVTGPSLHELAGATCWVPEGWHGRTDDYGTLVLQSA